LKPGLELGWLPEAVDEPRTGVGVNVTLGTSDVATPEMDAGDWPP
jgi:hypothetical protein